MHRRLAPSRTLPVAALLAALPLASAMAGPQQDHRRPQHATPQEQAQEPQAPPRQESRRLSESVRRAERDSRGEVISAERVQSGDRDMHRVKVVDERGRVRVYMQDPQHREEAPPSPSPPGKPRRPVPASPRGG